LKEFITKKASRIGILLMIFSLSVCVEPYKFRIKDNNPSLVIEAQISNLSYNETLESPSEGRFFKVILRKTSDVVNIRDEVETGASVILESDKNEQWMYAESYEKPGKYLLYDDNFEAEESVQYRLKIRLSNGEEYESSWEGLPKGEPQDTGDITFKEKTVQGYKYIAGDKEIRDIKGIDLYINLPENQQKETNFYQWSFDATWVYEAPFTSQHSSIKKCWISNKNYLSNYVLQNDNTGDYPQKLVFIETVNNDRIYKDFSLLITQIKMSESYYLFWEELQEQTKNGGLFDAPPYNLQSNFTAINSDKTVTGFFGVVDEKAIRWNFSISDLSYQVDDRTTELCSISYGPDGPGGPECYNCLEYPYGNASNIKPSWWDNR
jgi:hypothetical protein